MANGLRRGDRRHRGACSGRLRGRADGVPGPERDDPRRRWGQRQALRTERRWSPPDRNPRCPHGRRQWSSGLVAGRHEDRRFARRGGGIYIADASGRHQVRIAPGGHEPAWSPDGSQILFTRGDWLHVVRADGRGLRRLFPGRDAQWSPDGTRIAFGFRERSLDDIYVAALDGSGRVRLTTAWSGECYPLGPLYGGSATLTRPGRPTAHGSPMCRRSTADRTSLTKSRRPRPVARLRRWSQAAGPGTEGRSRRCGPRRPGDRLLQRRDRSNWSESAAAGGRRDGSPRTGFRSTGVPSADCGADRAATGSRGAIAPTSSAASAATTRSPAAQATGSSARTATTASTPATASSTSSAAVRVATRSSPTVAISSAVTASGSAGPGRERNGAQTVAGRLCLARSCRPRCGDRACRYRAFRRCDRCAGNVPRDLRDQFGRVGPPPRRRCGRGRLRAFQRRFAGRVLRGDPERASVWVVKRDGSRERRLVAAEAGEPILTEFPLV